MRNLWPRVLIFARAAGLFSEIAAMRAEKAAVCITVSETSGAALPQCGIYRCQREREGEGGRARKKERRENECRKRQM